MTVDEKRQEVAGRMARSRRSDAENCTGVWDEFYSLIFNGCRGVADWSEPELDDYLATHDADGNPVDGEDEDEETED